jgi:hypothetical protein
MTTETYEPQNPHTIPEPGTIGHALVDGLTIPDAEAVAFVSTGRVLSRGDVFVITEPMLAASRNRFDILGGVGLLLDPDEQVRRWGAQRFAEGIPADDFEKYVRGTAEWEEARAEAVRAAAREPDAEVKAYKFAEVTRRFGPPLPTSRAVERPDGEGPEERANRLQAEANIARGETYSIKSWES